MRVSWSVSEWQAAWMDGLAGTDSGLLQQQHEANLAATKAAYPYFLFPAASSPPGLSSAYYELEADVARSLEDQHPQVGRPKIFLLEPDSTAARSRTLRVFENERWHTRWMLLAAHGPPSTASSTDSHQLHRHRHQHNHQQHATTPEPFPDTSPRRFAPRPTFEHGALAGYEPGADDEQRRLEAPGERGPASADRLPIERLFDSRPMQPPGILWRAISHLVRWLRLYRSSTLLIDRMLKGSNFPSLYDSLVR